MKRFNLFGFLLLSFLILSCSEDDSFDVYTSPLKDYSDSYLVLNEGNFSDGVGTVNYISSDLLATTRRLVYQTINGNPIGTVLQSGTIVGDEIYLVVNASNKIEILDRFTFRSLGTITQELNKPRYISIKNNKMYVSNYGNAFDGSTNYISIYNLNDNSFIAKQPALTDGLINKVYSSNDYIYALNDGLYLPPTFSLDPTNKVSVSNTLTGDFETLLSLSSEPNSAVVIGNELYVLCSGYSDFSGNVIEEAAIWKITGLTTTKVFDFVHRTGDQTAKLLNHIGNTLYFVLNNDGESDVYSLPITGDITTDLDEVIDLAIISSLKDFSIQNNKLVVLDQINLSLVPGKAYFYESNGSLINTFSVGIFPGNVLYNPSR